MALSERSGTRYAGTAAHPRTSSAARRFILGSTPCSADRNGVTTLVSPEAGAREEVVQVRHTRGQLSITVHHLDDATGGSLTTGTAHRPRRDRTRRRTTARAGPAAAGL